MNRELIVWLVVGFLSLIGVWRVADWSYNRGAHSRDKEVSDLTAQVASAAVALNQCNDQAKLNEQAAKAQRNMADAALDAATQRDKGQSKELAEAVRKLTDARKTSDCKATAEAHLCPAMASY